MTDTSPAMDLPPMDPQPRVTAILALPSGAVDRGRRTTIDAGGIPFSALSWGDPAARPLILIHGVTASARIWWRIGPALAATGRGVIAVDLPGHGMTRHWQGRHRFRDTADDVAAWIRRAGLDGPGLQIVGHSWGAVTAAALPRSGIRPSTLVLLDPPAVPHAIIARMADDPSERVYDTVETAVAAVARENPGWSGEDVLAKAEALTQLDEAAARSIVFDNGDWDGGLADLLDPAADDIPTWIIRAEATPSGLTADGGMAGLLPDAALPAFAARLGADHILTLAGAAHAPQRTHPAETTGAILRALA